MRIESCVVEIESEKEFRGFLNFLEYNSNYIWRGGIKISSKDISIYNEVKQDFCITKENPVCIRCNDIGEYITASHLSYYTDIFPEVPIRKYSEVTKKGIRRF